MNSTLNIRPDGALDLVSLGALVHRLDPGIIPFRKAHDYQIHVSGGEFNVAANLADCFGLQTGIVSAMVDYPIGDLVAERVKAMGVRPFYKRFKHDGVTGPNIAAVYSDRDQGVRAPVVFYNRSNEAAARLKPGDFDWNAIFAGGVRWFHSGGIFAALSETTAELIIEAMRAAKAAGAVAWIDGKTHVAPECELHVLDRVGGGDGFASGFFYGLLAGESPEESIKLGWAHGALITTFPGDTTMATLEQVRSLAQGGSARIQR